MYIMCLYGSTVEVVHLLSRQMQRGTLVRSFSGCFGTVRASLFSQPAAVMYVYILSVGLYDSGQRACSLMQSSKHIS